MKPLQRTIQRFYFEKGRKSEIIHTRLRLEISDLKADLVKRHLAADATCTCGFPTENAKHYLFDCPLYQVARANTLLKLNNTDRTLNNILHGNTNKPLSENIAIFQLVSDFILQSSRFK